MAVRAFDSILKSQNEEWLAWACDQGASRVSPSLLPRAPHLCSLAHEH